MKRRLYSAAAVTCAAVLAAGAPALAASHDTGAATANGGASSVLGATPLMVNGATWDPHFADSGIPGLLSRAGAGMVRWPGGSYADTYDWRTDTPGGNVPFSQFMNEIAQAKASPFITANYGDASLGPDVAASWVRDAKTFPGYSDRTALWEVGNEDYGPWESDTHPGGDLPQSYATNALPYFRAMHAADPNSRVGFPYTLNRFQSPGTGTWVPDPDAWNDTVLKQDGAQIDFADVHWYPVFGNPSLTPAQIMASVRKIPQAMASVKATLGRYDPRAFVVAGESNISQTGVTANEQPIAALYSAATALEFLSHGARSYGWWDIHNTANADQDFGFLSDGGTAPGPFATTLASAANNGTRNLPVSSAGNFTVGHTITIGAGADEEHREITALPGTTTLSAPAAQGQHTVNVTNVAPFAPGTPVTIGTQHDTVTSAGTGASTDTLAAPANPGDTVIHVEGTAEGGQSTPVFMPPGFAPGGTVTIGSGSNRQSVRIKSVGTSSSLATTSAAATPAGATRVRVATVGDTTTGVAFYAGDPVVIGGQTDTITSVGTSGADGTGITLAKPLARATESGVKVQDAGTGITLDTPLAKAHAIGETAATPGTGIILAAPLARSHPAGAQAAGSGVTVTPALGAGYASGTTVTDPGQKEPALDTPMPAYDGYELASRLTAPGARLTALPASDPALFAFTSSDGATLVINADDAHARTYPVPAGDTKTETYSLENPDIVPGATAAGTVSLPPESIEVLRP